MREQRTSKVATACFFRASILYFSISWKASLLRNSLGLGNAVHCVHLEGFLKSHWHVKGLLQTKQWGSLCGTSRSPGPFLSAGQSLVPMQTPCTEVIVKTKPSSSRGGNRLCINGIRWSGFPSDTAHRGGGVNRWSSCSCAVCRCGEHWSRLTSEPPSSTPLTGIRREQGEI